MQIDLARLPAKYVMEHSFNVTSLEEISSTFACIVVALTWAMLIVIEDKTVLKELAFVL